MRVDFVIPERLAGFAAEAAEAGQQVKVIVCEALTSLDGSAFLQRMERLDTAIFSHVPGLPRPSEIDHLLVVIRPDLTATAYLNELQFKAAVVPAGPVQVGQSVYTRDILDISSLELGVDIPSDCAIVLVRSFRWRRALFYDLRPLANGEKRPYDLSGVLAKQTLSLIRERPGDGQAPVPQPERLVAGLTLLEALLNDRCNDEARYQELFRDHPWILLNAYSSIERHQALDDLNIPDFTGVRHKDGHRDIIEIKPPFTDYFKADCTFNANFNEAWNQTERYLNFVRLNRDYLRNEKGLIFENPRCLLILGQGFTEPQRRAIRDKESMNLAIEVLTYETVHALGTSFFNLARAAWG